MGLSSDLRFKSRLPSTTEGSKFLQNYRQSKAPPVEQSKKTSEALQYPCLSPETFCRISWVPVRLGRSMKRLAFEDGLDLAGPKRPSKAPERGALTAWGMKKSPSEIRSVLRTPEAIEGPNTA